MSTPALVMPWTTDIIRGWRVIQEPTQEPISMELARSHLRLTAVGSPPVHRDDAWLQEVGLPGARQYCEGFMMRSCAPQTIELQMSRFPGTIASDGGTAIELLYGPVAEVESVNYLDSGGTEVAASDWAFSNVDPPRLYLTSSTGALWPDTLAVPGAIRVRYRAGYSIDESPTLTPPLPAAIKIAILMMLAHLYEQREATSLTTLASAAKSVAFEVPLGVAVLLRPYVLRLSMA